VKLLTTLKILNITSNKVEDISFVESLECLEIFKAENNQISSISSLNKCPFLRIVELGNNNLRYLTSSLKTFNNLINMKELSIFDNPVNIFFKIFNRF
jgi:Leucine-rich repeat (LRR) protein